ncbi:MAG: hypothetical protein LBE81_13375 [Azonexus sp.]|jgi:hypothetical protein|uniref:hypothetical protein n=1 Tax=Azonexus sp. TaxID=1872668 RepID=UPI00283575C1|nr:hypothetical protein [Azonexus sp.]MDR0777608.1 hypothetical protein [Azonexus sp.]
MATTLVSLRDYVGKSIGDICSNGFSTPTQNHCAHFVSHALGIQLGMLCGDMAWETRKTGASIRCDELYNRLVSKGEWEDKPVFADGLLIFVTSAANVRNGVMANHPRKHVGIHFGGQVFNFSNSQSQVVADQSVEAFHNKFKRSYGGQDISLFFGVAP